MRSKVTCETLSDDLDRYASVLDKKREEIREMEGYIEKTETREFISVVAQDNVDFWYDEIQDNEKVVERAETRLGEIKAEMDRLGC